MNEAVGNAALFNLAIVFVVILIAFFVGSLSYSKAYKVKNKIVEEIEKQGEYAEDATKAYSLALPEINEWLDSGNAGKGIGYRKNTNPGLNNVNNCGSGNLVNQTSNYEYCVYIIDTCSGKTDTARCGVYYKVTTYMYFDIPIISDIIKIPVSSETMTFTKLNG